MYCLFMWLSHHRSTQVWHTFSRDRMVIPAIYMKRMSRPCLRFPSQCCSLLLIFAVKFYVLLRQPNLYPTVGLQTPGEIVEANFGRNPFIFDIEGYVQVMLLYIHDITVIFCISLFHVFFGYYFCRKVSVRPLDSVKLQLNIIKSKIGTKSVSE